MVTFGAVYYDQEIKLKKTLTIVFLVTCIMFVLVCIGVYVFAHTQIQEKQAASIMETASVIIAVVFALCAVYLVSRLSQTKIGLSFNSMGFTDQSSFLSQGFVPWNDVKGLKVIEVKKQKLLAVLLKNPETYINHVTGIKKWLVKINNKLYGTPVLIPANTLDISFDELHRQFEQMLTRYGRKNSISSF